MINWHLIQNYAILRMKQHSNCAVGPENAVEQYRTNIGLYQDSVVKRSADIQTANFIVQTRINLCLTPRRKMPPKKVTQQEVVVPARETRAQAAARSKQEKEDAAKAAALDLAPSVVDKNALKNASKAAARDKKKEDKKKENKKKGKKKDAKPAPAAPAEDNEEANVAVPVLRFRNRSQGCGWNNERKVPNCEAISGGG